MIARMNFKHTGERVRMATVRKFGAENFNARMEHTQTKIRCVLIYPILKQWKKKSFNFYVITIEENISLTIS